MLPVEKKCGYICIVLQIFKIPELTSPLKSHSPEFWETFLQLVHGEGGGENAMYACKCLSSD